MSHLPGNGHSILDAFRHLLPEKHQHILAMHMFGKSLQGPSEAQEVVRLRAILWDYLAENLRTGTLVASGFAHGKTMPEPIHPAFFNNAVPDYVHDAVSMNGVTYAGVRVSFADAMPLTQDSVSADVRPEPDTIAPPPPSVSVRKGMGGAPPTYLWLEFIVEVIRFANVVGFGTRRELSDHMREWVAGHWTVQPDAETLRRKIKELCPPETPLN